MKDTARALAGLPDDARCSLVVGSGDLTVGELREALRVQDDSLRHMTASEAAEEFGMSADWWGRRAKDVPGAWQEGRYSTWHLPASGCRAYLAARQDHRKSRMEGWRGPNRKADAPAARARATGVQEGQVVGGGSEAVGQRQADAA